MIQFQNSKCSEHQSLILAFDKIGNSNQRIALCQICILDLLKQKNCKQVNEKIRDLVKIEIVNLQQEIKQGIKLKGQSVQQLASNVILQGPKINEQKNGNFFYVFDDGTQLYAGLYEFNRKNGFWNELVTTNYQFDESDYQPTKKKRMNVSYYENGRKICFSEMVEQKIITIEKFGMNDQLIFQGQSRNNKKNGDWQIMYKDKKCGGGNFNDQGLKTGEWTEVFEKYNNCCQLTYIGQYYMGLRIGKWSTLYFDEMIGGGFYDELGIKTGLWIDFDENSNYPGLVLFQGSYEKGQRVGNWAVFYKKNFLGSGFYDETGLKIQKWIEPISNFNYHCQVIQSGEYKDGLRSGKWETLRSNDVIGGGNYNEIGCKSGQWQDLHDNFNDKCQVTYFGEYNSGFKVGLWKTLLKNNEIGGGYFNEKGLKLGRWVDVHDNFNDKCQIIYSGEYRNGKRFGKWEIYYKDNQIGGGIYNEMGMKSGPWIDLHENFTDHCQVTTFGEYKDGLQVGLWKTSYKNNQIGGGTFDEKGVKTGKWIDLCDHFNDDCQVLQIGQYRNGLRTGIWKFESKTKIIGGGFYNEMGVKSGQWTDLHWAYTDTRPWVFTGEYIKGLRSGLWEQTINQISKYMQYPDFRILQ